MSGCFDSDDAVAELPVGLWRCPQHPTTILSAVTACPSCVKRTEKWFYIIPSYTLQGSGSCIVERADLIAAIEEALELSPINEVTVGRKE